MIIQQKVHEYYCRSFTKHILSHLMKDEDRKYIYDNFFKKVIVSINEF